VKAKRLIKTLRGRLTGWYLVILAITLALFTALLYVSLDTTLDRHHDPELREDAQQLARALAGTAIDAAAVGEAVRQSRLAGQFIMVRGPHGDLMYASPLLQVSEPNIGKHQALVHAAAVGTVTPEFFTTRLERWGQVRFVCVPIDASPRVYLQVGMPLGDVTATRRMVMTVCVVLIPIVLTLMSAGGWITAGHALAPMKAIDNTLRSIQGTDLSRRIDVSPSDAELGGLVATINQLLGRLEQSFASLKQFAADVSHQLQTPLTVMKGNLEVMSASRQTLGEHRKRLAEIAEEVDEMTAVIADLRALSLADSGPMLGQRGPVDLSSVVQETAEILEALAESKGASLDASIQSGVTVWGSALPLKQVVLNLGDNAVKYTEAGGHVRLQLHAEARDAVLRVADTGIGIPPEALPHIYERFYRVANRDARSAGTGLGLAIVKRIVDAHGGSIHVDSRPGEGSVFTVRLPLASA
jgi:signal transduction histidine kinase